MKTIKRVLLGAAACCAPLSGAVATEQSTIDPWNGRFLGIHAGEIQNFHGAKEQDASWRSEFSNGRRADIPNSPIITPGSDRGSHVLDALYGSQKYSDISTATGISFGQNWRLGPSNPGFVAGLVGDITRTNIRYGRTDQETYSRGLGYSFSETIVVPPISLGFFTIPGSTTILTANALVGFSAEQTTESSSHMDWLATFRGRMGYLISEWTLFYVTGGPALGHIKARMTTRGSYCGNTSASINLIGSQVPVCNGSSITGTTSVNSSSTPINIPAFDDGNETANPTSWSSSASRASSRLGWSLGMGFEHRITQNLTLKAEYLRYDLGSISVRNTMNVGAIDDDNSPATSVFKANSFRFAGDNWRVGLNYYY
jgi:opacity protein-like surface antigen